MKRRLGHFSDSEENLFNINDYKLTSLNALISMIEDYQYKKLPKKRAFVNYYAPKLISTIARLNFFKVTFIFETLGCMFAAYLTKIINSYAVEFF